MKLRQRFILMAIWVMLNTSVFAQLQDIGRIASWKAAGLLNEFDTPEMINILDYGADSTGVFSSYEAYVSALAQNQGQTIIIFFPEGNYFFDKSIHIPSNCTLKGEGAELSRLHFDLSGKNHCITVHGKISGNIIAVKDHIQAGDEHVITTVNPDLESGDWVRLWYNDSLDMSSGWAYGLGGGLYQIRKIEADKIFFTQVLRQHIHLDKSPGIQKIDPLKNAGLECLYISRQDSTAGQTSNISVRHAVNCRFIGLESEKTNFAHLDIMHAQHMLVRGCYFQDSHAFGGGGQGYGIVLQSGSGHCLIENNQFRKLRHSILLQSAANANVIAYNSSVQPYWTDTFLPSDAAGDLVCHGNYPYLNLFEGNIVQNIVVDASHGKNGPHNTFFRNRAMNYGILMSPGSGTDSTHFIANEVPNTAVFKGLYTLTGNGNIQSGNIVKGILTPPGNTTEWSSSLYRDSVPGYWTDDQVWPSIGEPETFNQFGIPARKNWLDSIFTDCRLNPEYIPVVSSADMTEHAKVALEIFPNPGSDYILMKYGTEIINEVIIYNLNAQIVLQTRLRGSSGITIRELPPGIYIIRAMTSEKKILSGKFIKTEDGYQN